MAFKDVLLPEFDQETGITRKHLERVPEDKFTWKPHAKSGSMIWLAAQIANIPGWAVTGLTSESLDMAPGGVPAPQPAPPATRQELLDLFDRNVLAAREAIAGADDAHLAKSWSLLRNGQTVLTMPRTSVLRIFVMNHLIHHRAQLGMYFRLNDVPVPSTYGPSADEGAM
jgi:uncharacterized damage-inducible protein DinB